MVGLRYRAGATAGLIVLAACGPVAAAEIPPAVLAAACTACHGPGGKSPGAIPSLDRLAPDAVRKALLAFRSGQTQGTVMNRLARGFSESEIDAIASVIGAPTP
jgi:cytochrome subunit of sulfide dehydrogenase